MATRTTDEAGERELLKAIASGDTHALGDLYDRFAILAYGLALQVLRDRDLAEDAVHEAFLSVWRSAPSFESRHGSVRAWLLMLVHRNAVARRSAATAGYGRTTSSALRSACLPRTRRRT